MSKTSKARGNARLLKLANILEAIPLGATNKRGEPAYCQLVYFHECGTPACALGYWVWNQKRWDSKKMLLCRGTSGFTYLDVREEFALDSFDFNQLFGITGCNDARNDPQAAARFIRSFVEARK